MTKRIPCRLNRLLKILNLLADLLQFGLAADDALGDCSVIRFRSERVEFAKNLLRDEFQCAPNRLFAAQMMGKLSKMTLKSRQLFRYISAIGKERNFFQDALVLVSQRQPSFCIRSSSAARYRFTTSGCSARTSLSFFELL